MSKVVRLSQESCTLLDICRGRLALGCKLSDIPIKYDTLSDSSIINIALNNLAVNLDRCWKEVNNEST